MRLTSRSRPVAGTPNKNAPEILVSHRVIISSLLVCTSRARYDQRRQRKGEFRVHRKSGWQSPQSQAAWHPSDYLTCHFAGVNHEENGADAGSNRNRGRRSVLPAHSVLRFNHRRVDGLHGAKGEIVRRDGLSSRPHSPVVNDHVGLVRGKDDVKQTANPRPSHRNQSHRQSPPTPRRLSTGLTTISGTAMEHPRALSVVKPLLTGAGPVGIGGGCGNLLVVRPFSTGTGPMGTWCYLRLPLSLQTVSHRRGADGALRTWRCSNGIGAETSDFWCSTRYTDHTRSSTPRTG